MTNRLELNWKLDGFVDEQRYYCSEDPIDINNPPEPKSILAENVRSHIDYDVLENATYHVAVASVKNGVAKFSDVVNITTNADPHKASVISLLHFDSDTVDNTGKIWIKNGDVAIDHDVKKFGSGSLRTPASNNSLLSCSHSDFDLGVDPFTIEGWVRPQSESNDAIIQVGGLLFYTASNAFALYHAIAGNVIAAGIPNLNLFQNFVVQKTPGGVLELFIGGEKIGSAAFSHALSTAVASIGYFNSGNPGRGWVDEIRITKGIARYSDNFTPKNKPFDY